MTSLNASLARLAGVVPVTVRVIIGVIMAAHGWQKVTQMGPANFGNGMLADLGLPLPGLLGYVVSYAELIGGLLLIAGLLTRVTAIALLVILAGATVLVKLDLGLIAGMGAPLPGAELDLALIAGLLVSALIGPGRLSLDHVLGLEDRTSTIDLTRVGTGTGQRAGVA